VDGTGSGQCPMAGFDIGGVEHSDFATLMLLTFKGTNAISRKNERELKNKNYEDNIKRIFRNMDVRRWTGLKWTRI
jgi:hypothetical protein